MSFKGSAPITGNFYTIVPNEEVAPFEPGIYRRIWQVVGQNSTHVVIRAIDGPPATLVAPADDLRLSTAGRLAGIILGREVPAGDDEEGEADAS